MQCLAEFDMKVFQMAILEFLINEVYVTRELRNLENSLKGYWIETVKNDEVKTELNLIMKEAIEIANHCYNK
jgi:hypothetical protein